MEFNATKLAEAYNKTDNNISYITNYYCPYAESVDERFGSVDGHTINYDGKNYLISFDFHEDSQGEQSVSDLTLQCELTDEVYELSVDKEINFAKQIKLNW